MCLMHYKLKISAWNKRSQYRKQIGFCGQCKLFAEPGRSRCTKHRLAQVKSNGKRVAAAAIARGWKLARVPV
jgi:hypothetical protein